MFLLFQRNAAVCRLDIGLETKVTYNDILIRRLALIDYHQRLVTVRIKFIPGGIHLGSTVVKSRLCHSDRGDDGGEELLSLSTHVVLNHAHM